MDPAERRQRLAAFAQNLAPTDKVAVVYDSDPDGFSAGVLVAKAVEKVRGKRPGLVMVQEHKRSTVSARTLKKLQQAGIRKVIFVDMAVEQEPEPLLQVAEFAEVVIFDHHKIYQLPESEKIILLKSQFFADIDGSKYPTAKLVFDLFSEITDMKHLAWIASIGVTGDMSYDQWSGFVDTALREAGISMEQLESYVHAIGATITVNREEISELFDVFMQADHPQELKLEKFEAYVQETEAELQRLLKEFDEKAEINEGLGLIFFTVESRLGMKSALINVISTQRFPDKTIILMQENDTGMVTLSARRQDFKIKMNELLEQAVEGLDKAKAGGHIPAAGGVIRREDLETFKQRIAEILKSGKAKN